MCKKWIVTYAGYNEPDGYPVYKYVCPYCGGGNGGKYCRDCGHRIKGRIPDETVADDFKEIFMDNSDNEEN